MTTPCWSDVSMVVLFSWHFVSVPSPSSDTPSVPMVTPARPLLRNTPASLFRQTGRTDDPTAPSLVTSTCSSLVSAVPQWLPEFQMFPPFWRREFGHLDSRTRPEMFWAVWWETETHPQETSSAWFCQLNAARRLFSIWTTATGPPAFSPPPRPAWRTRASSTTTWPTWARLCWRRTTLERQVGEATPSDRHLFPVWSVPVNNTLWFLQRPPVFSQSSLLPFWSTLLLRCLSCWRIIGTSARKRCVWERL